MNVTHCFLFLIVSAVLLIDGLVLYFEDSTKPSFPLCIFHFSVVAVMTFMIVKYESVVERALAVIKKAEQIGLRPAQPGEPDEPETNVSQAYQV